MLTLDDLEHFSDRSMAHLFAPPGDRPDADKLARLARIIACLNTCRAVDTHELVEDGLIRARFLLKTALRQQQRGSRPDPAALLLAMEAALAALGQGNLATDGPGAVPRMEVEAEIQTVAARHADEPATDGDLLGSLARGEFDLRPTSNLAALEDVAGRSGVSAQVDVDLAIDTEGPSDLVRVRLLLEGGLWRWTALEGCCMSRNGQQAFFLPPEDPVVQSLLAGLALRGGRTVLSWVEALEAEEA